MFSPRHVHLASVALLAVLILAAPAQAQSDGGGPDIDIDIDIDEIVDAIEDLADELQDFVEEWDETLVDVLKSVLFQPFLLLAQQLVNYTTLVLTTTPQIYPNPAVEEIHALSLAVASALTGLILMWAGLLHIIGPVFGISYREVRRILPRVVAGLLIASISLPLLQLLVDLTDALVHAFRPRQLTASTTQLAGLSTGLVLAWVAESIILLGVVALFIIRDVYILFFAAASPLFLVMWSVPRIKRYADTFIGGFFAALLFAPLDVLALRFCLALLNGSGGTAIQNLSNWIIGVASFTLLLIIPYQLWTASQSAVGTARKIAGGITKQSVTRQKPQANTRLQTPSQRPNNSTGYTYQGEFRDD
jgi:hypothetical protein